MDYGGEVTPSECWAQLHSEDPAILIDVRTRAEWAYVGLPALPAGTQPMIGQEWQVFPEMAIDPGFVTALTSRLKELGATTDSQLCFLCRSGVRSLAAARAMAAAGYTRSFNVTGGFEGDPDEEQHRGNRNGWKAEGLPWQQS